MVSKSENQKQQTNKKPNKNKQKQKKTKTKTNKLKPNKQQIQKQKQTNKQKQNKNNTKQNKKVLASFCSFPPFHFQFFIFPFSILNLFFFVFPFFRPLFSRLVSRNFPIRSLGGHSAPCPLPPPPAVTSLDMLNICLTISDVKKWIYKVLQCTVITHIINMTVQWNSQQI